MITILKFLTQSSYGGFFFVLVVFISRAGSNLCGLVGFGCVGFFWLLWEG